MTNKTTEAFKQLKQLMTQERTPEIVKEANDLLGKIKLEELPETNLGRLLFIDRVCMIIPDPLCKVSSTGLCSHRLSQIDLV